MLESNVVLLKSSVQLACDIVRFEFQEIHEIKIQKNYLNSAVKAANTLIDRGELRDEFHLKCFFLGMFCAYYSVLVKHTIAKLRTKMDDDRKLKDDKKGNKL